MGKEYTDEVAWVLDGAAESISNGRCTGLTPSDTLYEMWSAWQEAIAKVLIGWGDKHGYGDRVALLLQSERYFAWDVYATLEGAGVGTWDGRWDQYIGRAKRDEITNLVKQHLREEFATIADAVENEAYEQCEGDDEDDTAVLFEGIRRPVESIRRTVRTDRLPSWARRPRR